MLMDVIYNNAGDELNQKIMINGDGMMVNFDHLFNIGCNRKLYIVHVPAAPGQNVTR